MIDVGTGSGDHAAILSVLARDVIGVERVEAFASRASETLAALGYRKIQNHRRRRQRRLRARCPVVTALSSAPAHRVCPDRSGINLPMAAVSHSRRNVRSPKSSWSYAPPNRFDGSQRGILRTAHAQRGSSLQTQRHSGDNGLAHVLFIDGDRNCVLTCCAISLHFVGYESQTEKARARDRR